MERVRGIQPGELATLLAGADLFETLADDELETLASFSGLYALEAGELLYEPGYTGGELYVIANGSIEVVRTADADRQETVARFIRGESFGELDLISKEPREETARAAGPTRVLIFPRREEEFEAILAARPELGARLLRKLMSAVAARLRQANDLYRRNSLWVRELQRQVYTDPLTGLYNRVYLEENLESRLVEERSALLMFKPDNFKQINDTFGHEAGDEGIRRIGAELRRLKEADEVVVRYMGNEYALILPIGGESLVRERAKLLQERLIGIKYGRDAAGNDIVVTVSVGIALYPTHSRRPLELIQKAHEAAMRGRTLGGSKILFNEEETE